MSSVADEPRGGVKLIEIDQSQFLYSSPKYWRVSPLKMVQEFAACNRARPLAPAPRAFVVAGLPRDLRPYTPAGRKSPARRERPGGRRSASPAPRQAHLLLGDRQLAPPLHD